MRRGRGCLADEPYSVDGAVAGQVDAAPLAHVGLDLAIAPFSQQNRNVSPTEQREDGDHEPRRSVHTLVVRIGVCSYAACWISCGWSRGAGVALRPSAVRFRTERHVSEGSFGDIDAECSAAPASTLTSVRASPSDCLHP